MEVRKAYKLRLYPNRQQEQVLLQTIGASRFIYNYYLCLQINAYFQTGKRLPYADLSRDLTRLRNSHEYPWMSEVRSTPLQQSLRILEVAFGNFYSNSARLPRFKTRRDAKQSFRKPHDWHIVNRRLSIQRDTIIRCRGTLPPSTAKLGTLTVSVTRTGKWYASICVTEIIEPPTEHTSPLGIDLGLADLAITSSGKKYPNPGIQKKRLARLKQLNQSLSRKQKGSKRREKAKLEVARLHEKIANQRMNHLHQVSSAITRKNHALIAVEDLAVLNMLKNRRLSRSISDVSWSELLRQLEYKQLWRGGEFIKIGRFFPSSKTCSNCLFVMQDLPLSVRRWTCPRCNIEHDRDVNAAKNVLKQAETQLGVESTDGAGRKAGRFTGSVKRGYVYA